MGTAYLADGITGINLAWEEEVVVFLTSRNTAFPYDERVNQAPAHPCDLFRINSLPIFGKLNKSNSLEVDETQLGVVLALRMTGCAAWEEFEGKAVHGKGVSIAVKSRGQQSLQDRQADARARTYGLFVISRDTFNRVKRKVRFTGEKPVRSDASLRREQVGQVLQMFDAYLEVQRFMRGEPVAGQSAAERILEDRRRRLTGLVTATALESATEYQNEAGDLVMLPMLSRAFGDGFGGAYGRDFLNLTRSLGFRGADVAADGAELPAKAADIPNLTRFLELAWETQRLYFGMRYLNALVTPSSVGGNRANRVDVIEMARQTIEAAFLTELNVLAGFDSLPRQYKDVRLQLTRAKAMLAKLDEHYDDAMVKARADAKAATPDAGVVREVAEVVLETDIAAEIDADVANATVGKAEPAGVTGNAPDEAASHNPADVATTTVRAKRGRKAKATLEAGSAVTPEVTSQPKVGTEESPQSVSDAAPVEQNGAVAETGAESTVAKDVEALKKKYGLATTVEAPF